MVKLNLIHLICLGVIYQQVSHCSAIIHLSSLKKKCQRYIRSQSIKYKNRQLICIQQQSDGSSPSMDVWHSASEPEPVLDNSPTKQEILSDLKSTAVFQRIRDLMSEDPSVIKKSDNVFVFQILKEGETVATWTIDLKQWKIYDSAPKKYDMLVSAEDEDVAKLYDKTLRIKTALSEGRVSISKASVVKKLTFKSLLTTVMNNKDKVISNDGNLQRLEAKN